MNEIAANAGEVITVVKTVRNCGLQAWPATTCLVEDRAGAEDDAGLLVGGLGPEESAELKIKVTAPLGGANADNLVFRLREKRGGAVFGEKIKVTLNVLDPSYWIVKHPNS